MKSKVKKFVSSLTFSPWSKKSPSKIRKDKVKKNIKLEGFSCLRNYACLKIGEVYTFNVTALGANNIGIDEFSYGHPVFLPNTQIGDVVKAKIVKMVGYSNNQPYKYVIAQVIKKITGIVPLKSQIQDPGKNLSNKQLGSTSNIELQNQVGDSLTVTIVKSGPRGTGIAEVSNNYFVIVPNTIKGEIATVQITRIKAKFAFAKKINTALNKRGVSGESGFYLGESRGSLTNLQIPFSLQQQDAFKRILSSLPQTGINNFNKNSLGLLQGSKIQLFLPRKIKRIATHFVLKIAGMVLFVKPTLGAKPGNKVKIKCIKVVNYKNRVKFAIGKIIRVSPQSKRLRRIEQFGQQKKANRFFISQSERKKAEYYFDNKITRIHNNSDNSADLNNYPNLKYVHSSSAGSLIRGTIRQMLQNGMHFGEKAIKCHARMKKYIWLNKNGQNKNKPLVKKGRHLMNLLKTRRCLKKALTQLSKYALKGRPFLFVGTKKSAASLIARASLFSKTAFFVNTRWLGGLLTNWKSILKSISKIRPILKQKQKIIKRILEKRKNIKINLLQKARVFRKKSKLLIKKGRAIVSALKIEKNQILFKNRSLMLNTKREKLLEKAQNLLDKRQKFLKKRYHINMETNKLKQKGILIEKKYKTLLSQYVNIRQKLREFTTLLIISKQIALNKANTKVAMVNATKLQVLNQETGAKHILPDPPKDILKKIFSVLSINSSTTPPIVSKLKNLEKRDSFGQQKVVILSKLLSQFTTYIPVLRNSIQNLILKNKQLERQFLSLKQTLTLIKNKIVYYISLKQKLTVELRKIQATLVAERRVARLLKRKMRQVIAQKRLIKFLPKLRYLPTPQIQITETVKYLMKNIVDPKLKYPIEMIYDEKVKNQSKKIAAARKKKWQRLEKYFGGIAKMTKITGLGPRKISKMVAIIIGQQEELNAVRECQKFGIKMFHIVDTNCNPSLSDHFIPANDDSINSIRFLLTAFLKHIRLAQKLRLRVTKLRKKQSIKQRLLMA
nr:ribosomal protein S2 [Palmellopsis texensis]